MDQMKLVRGMLCERSQLQKNLLTAGIEWFFCSCLLLEIFIGKNSLNIGCEIAKLDGLIAGEGDLTQTLDVAEEYNIDTIILDGYTFGSNYLSALCEKYQLIFIDDEI